MSKQKDVLDKNEIVSFLKDTANAIRYKIGDDKSIKGKNIPAEIKSIPTVEKSYVDGEIEKIKEEMPKNVSDLNNDSNFITKNDSKTAITEEIAKVIANAPEDFDTLKEISDWIEGHEDSASAMNTKIKENTERIDELTITQEELDEILNN